MASYLYVSLAGEDKISIFTMDPGTGRLLLQEDVAVGGGPAPLAVDPQSRFLYAGLRSIREISSFRIDQTTGGLSLIGTVSLDADPCYLRTDRKGGFLLSSYYGAGRAAVHPIGADGVVGGSPVEWLSTANKAHSIQTDPSNRFAFVPHVAGPNLIFQFEFDETTGALKPNAVPVVIPEEESGPRHFCFHPSKDIAYFVNEQGCSVTAYHFDPSAGTLAAFQTVSTQPESFDGENSCAQIQITPSGRFLYAPNRGHDSIACFSVDASTGELTAIGHQPTEKTPRAFTLDPEGRFLFAAGLDSGVLAAYRIDLQSGVLKPLETYAVGKQPMWVLGVRLAD